MNIDQPVHDLNPYVLCSYVLFLSHYAKAGSLRAGGKLGQTAQLPLSVALFYLIIFLQKYRITPDLYYSDAFI